MHLLKHRNAQRPLQRRQTNTGKRRTHSPAIIFFLAIAISLPVNNSILPFVGAFPIFIPKCLTTVQRQLRRKDAVDLKLTEHNRKRKGMPKREADPMYHHQNQKSLKIHLMMNKRLLPKEGEVDLKGQRKRQLLLKERVDLVRVEVVAGHAKTHRHLKRMQPPLKKNKKMKKKKRVLTSKHVCLS